MFEEGAEEEVLSLMKHHGLKDQLDIFKAQPNDLNVQSRILLSAYTKTKEKEFFGLFYKHTYNFFFSCALNFLERFHAPIDAHDLTSETYMVVFNRLLDNELGPINNPVGFLYGTMRNVVNRHYKEGRKTKHISSDDQNLISCCNKPIDTLIMMEDDKKTELRKTWVNNILTGENEELTEKDREVLVDYYYNKTEVKEIARKNRVSVDNIYNIVYRSKEKIKRLAKSFISLTTEEEES